MKKRLLVFTVAMALLTLAAHSAPWGPVKAPAVPEEADGYVERTEQESSMLEMRPGCECCDVDLPPDSAGARICSFECTFCSRCAEKMGGLCPNCGGDLVGRPLRPARHLEKNPASTKRIVKPGGCAA